MESKHSIQELTLEEVMGDRFGRYSKAGSTPHFICYEQRRKHV